MLTPNDMYVLHVVCLPLSASADDDEVKKSHIEVIPSLRLCTVSLMDVTHVKRLDE